MASSGQDKTTADSTSGNDEQKKSSNIPDKVVQELNEAYKKHGKSGIIESVKEKLNEWKKVPLNIAITGSSGVGKSSYINALRGMTADDDGAAPVGVVETTASRTPYTHPENECFVLWDLPGVGSPNFPRDSYLEKIQFRRYDFFLVFSASRFTMNDKWLAQQIKQAGKHFYFIRTKIDLDISDNKKSHPITHSMVQVLQTVRSDCMTHLQNEGFTNPEVFIISNFDVNEFDFGQLSERLIKDAPDIKREALTLSLTNLTERIIRTKEKYLKKRIYIVSIASAAAAAVPIPGVGCSVDIAILLEEAVFYRQQLQLDEASFQENAAALNISVNELQRKLNLQSQIISFTSAGLLAFFASLGISNLSENILKLLLPIVGIVIASGISYGVQVHCLNKLLDIIVNDALRIHGEMTKISAKNAVDDIQTTQTEVKKVESE
ncbi:T-cell-specific guanine nucleotide triphosphate-binding protein 2-like isoform X2 [Mercenaria mercenaria]|nr:T-cell-specific guanine nucleotide triphosphate-binding protein 2-like isoform X2 [Mercenaria mercenaria]XP_045168164.2 T-cell-specific guanine nucleotide triphosphate-binding protein 2-like isoform X2 [Mercenaria mercenaria]